MGETPLHIGIIGYGKMGRALHAGWLNADFPAAYTIISPSETPRQDGDCRFFSTIESNAAQDALAQCRFIMLAVKPQVMATVCAAFKPFIAPDALILSIAAGQSLANYAAYFGEDQPVIRAMPNTPSMIGKGVTGYVCNAQCSAAQTELAHQLLSLSGHVFALDDEALIDPLSAVSGSGPAYVFYFTEALTQAGITLGLPAELSAALARQTVIGSSALMDHQAQSAPATLRQNVTSPGGTTQAALNHLMDGRVEGVLSEALQAAVRRAKEL